MAVNLAQYLQRQRRHRAFAAGDGDQPVPVRRQGLLPGDLDPAQPINRGLAWCMGSHPPGSSGLLGRDLCRRQLFTDLGGTAAFDAAHPDIAAWLGLDIKADDDVAEWSSFNLREITSAFSIACYLSPTAGETDSIMLVVPWADDNWLTPFYTIGMRIDGTFAGATEVSVLWSDGAALQSGINNGGDAWVGDGNPHWVVGVRDGATLQIYLDGVQQGTDVTVDGADVGWNASGSRQIWVGRGPAATQHFTDAQFHSAAIWKRALTAAEVAALNTNPTVQFIGGS